MWLWLFVGQAETYQLNTGSNQPGYIGTIGAAAVENVIGIMNLELPLFTIASQVNITYHQNVTNDLMDCQIFYTNYILLDAPTATSLCADPSNTFNFAENPSDYQAYIKSSIALMSVYFFAD